MATGGGLRHDFVCGIFADDDIEKETAICIRQQYYGQFNHDDRI